MNHQSMTELHERAVVHGDATNLTELEARLHVQHSALPPWRYHAADRALARLRESGFDLDCVSDVEELCQAHDHIVTTLSPMPSDEGSSLKLLLGFPQLAPDLAERIRAGTASLSDALKALSYRPDFRDPARIAGAIGSFAEIVEKRDGRSLAQIPARLKQIDARLAGMTHADFDVVKGTFDSMTSRIRTAVRLVDMSAGRRLPKTQLLPKWQDLITKIEAEAKKRQEKGRDGLMGDRAKLGRLADRYRPMLMGEDAETENWFWGPRRGGSGRNRGLMTSRINEIIAKRSQELLGKRVTGYSRRHSVATMFTEEALEKIDQVAALLQQRDSRSRSYYNRRARKVLATANPLRFWQKSGNRFSRNCGSERYPSPQSLRPYGSPLID
jgi:hypothetical protein